MRALVLAGVAVAASFVGLMLWATGGHFAAQVSDLHVVAQYARAMADGHPFRYNPGEAPTSGSTSLLHTALLALAHAAGARGEGLVAFAVLLGAAFYLASIALAFRVGARLGTPREARLAGALVLLGGPVVWGYLYGSDIALFLLLSLFTLERWLAFWQGGRAAGLAVALTLLALARPEGLPAAALLAVASAARPGPSPAPRERALPWLGVVAGVAVLLLQRAATGAWLGTSVSEKALLPSYGPVEALAAVSKYLVDVLRGLLLGFYPAEAPIGFAQGFAAFAFPPLGLLLVLLAAARPKEPLRGAVRTWLALVAALFLLAGPNVFMGVHFNRYLLWAFPGLLAFAAAGLAVATRLLAREDDRLERALFRAGAGLFLVLGLLSTARFAAAYGQMAGETARRELPMAAWIRAHLPPGVAIANAATSLEYLTGHRNLNLHGVTSAAFVGGRAAEREASLLELLQRLPAAERPPYLLLNRSGHEGSELMQALAGGPALFETTSLGDDLVLFPATYALVDDPDEPRLEGSLRAVASLELVDGLDVCDPVDERAHGYRYDSRLGEIVLAGSVRIDGLPLSAGARRFADAGRLVLGEERFSVRTRPGRELVVVLRSNATVVARGQRAQGGVARPVSVTTGAIVASAGHFVGAPTSLPAAPGWNEHVLRIPASAVSADATALRFSGRYAAFRYWFYQ